MIQKSGEKSYYKQTASKKEIIPPFPVPISAGAKRGTNVLETRHKLSTQ